MNYLTEQGIDNLFTGVSVGDVLCYNRRFGSGSIFTKAVAVTKTKAKCENGTEWNLRNGAMWGEAKWSRTYAYVVRDMEKVNALAAERAAREDETNKRNALANELPQLIRDFNKEELEALAAIVIAVKQRKA